MAEDDGKTEEPTDKKITDALDSGNIPVSREVSLLTGLVATLVAGTLVLPNKVSELVSTLMHFIDDPAAFRLEHDADAYQLGSIVVSAGATFLLHAVLLFMAFGVGGHVMQNPPRIIFSRIQIDLSRLSIGGGLKRLFGARGLTEFAKNCLKLVAVCIVAALVASSQKSMIFSAIFADAVDLPLRLQSLCVKITAAVTLFVLVIAGADLVWSRMHWRRELRMSRQDLKDEVKQAEGDRVMKMRFRSLRQARMRKRMLNSVPKATMVVVNPTHYAVALRYVRGEASAPLVLAKGVDLIALRIREIAEENDIPIIEDKPLARSLHDSVQVDATIPPEFYRAVAEIVHVLQGKTGLLEFVEAEDQLMTPENLYVAHDACERVLADAMVDVATELRLADPLEFLVMIRGNQEANITDLVNSSSELFFKSGALRYGLAARCDLRWEATPSVRLDMEFRHAAVTVFFWLTIGRAHAGVEIIRIMIDAGDDHDPLSATARMSHALWDARLR